MGAVQACGFGFLDAAAIRLQRVALPLIGVVSGAAIQALPDVPTGVMHAGFIGHGRAPKALSLADLTER